MPRQSTSQAQAGSGLKQEGLARPAPLHALPQPSSSFEPTFAPTIAPTASGSGSKQKENGAFGGTNFAMPKTTMGRSVDDSPTRATAATVQVPSPRNTRNKNGQSPPVTKPPMSPPNRGPANMESASSSGVRSLFIENCNVKLIEDIMIPAHEEGVLRVLDVKEGDRVEAGKVIGSVDTSRLKMQEKDALMKLELQRKKASSTAALDVAVQRYKLAKSEYQRDARLGRKGSASEQEVRRAKFSLDQSIAEVRVAQEERAEAAALAELEELKLAQIRFIKSKMEISTPFDGHVLEIVKHANEYVQKGEDIIRFARMDKLWVEATVSSDVCDPTDIIGQRVSVVLDQAGGEVKFEGKVVSVPLKMEGIGKRFRVRAEVANRFENGLWLLRPGASLSMTAFLKSATARRSNMPVTR